jgi:hypothetical protein
MIADSASNALYGALFESEAWNGPSFQECQNMGVTCGAFSTSDRSEVLSFGHHATLAKYTGTHPDWAFYFARQAVETVNNLWQPTRGNPFFLKRRTIER